MQQPLRVVVEDRFEDLTEKVKVGATPRKKAVLANRKESHPVQYPPR